MERVQTLGALAARAAALGAAHPCARETLAIGRTHGRVVAPLDGAAGGAATAGLFGENGERVVPGEDALECGQRLSPARIALAASLGVAALHVARRPTVALIGIAGGRAGADALDAVSEGMAVLLAGLARAEGLEPTAWPALADDARQVEISVRDAACAFDVVLVHLADAAAMRQAAEVIEQYGSDAVGVFHGESDTPAALLARVDAACVLAMQAPVSNVVATWLRAGCALTDALQGRVDSPHVVRAKLGAAVPPETCAAVPVRLAAGDGGGPIATPVAGSGFASFAHADAVWLCDPGTSMAAGSAVDVVLLR